jgi:Ca2+-binding EF-hand superfamily protein
VQPGLPVAPTASNTMLHVAKTNNNHNHRRQITRPNRSRVQSQRILERDSATIFSLIDADGNGDVSRKELKEYLLDSDGTYTEAVVDSIFTRLDTDRSGSISLGEFHHALQEHELFRAAPGIELEQKPPRRRGATCSTTSNFHSETAETQERQREKGPGEDSLKELYDEAKGYFREIDTDRDGSISVSELKDYFMLKKMTQVALKSGLLQQSKNKDKSMSSKREFVFSEPAVDNVFDLLDRNSDGRISFGELRDAFVRYHAVRQSFRA